MNKNNRRNATNKRKLFPFKAENVTHAVHSNQNSVRVKHERESTFEKSKRMS